MEVLIFDIEFEKNGKFYVKIILNSLTLLSNKGQNKNKHLTTVFL